MPDNVIAANGICELSTSANGSTVAVINSLALGPPCECREAALWLMS